MRRIQPPHHARKTTWAAAALLALTAVAAPPFSVQTADAQMVPAPPKLNVEGGRKGPEPAETKNLEMVEKLDEQVPLDLTFTNEDGETVELADYFQSDKPVILNLGYYGCPMLCGQVIRGLSQSLHELEQQDDWVPSDQYEVVTISFDHREDLDMAVEAKKNAMPMFEDDASAARGWHFLTSNAENVKTLADAVGFPYRWSEESQQYVHPAAIILLSPDGKVTRYLYGVSFPTATMRLSLVEASQGKVGSTSDQILLYCFQYDSERGEYTMVAMNMMRIAGALTVIVLAIAIGVMTVRSRHAAAAHSTERADSTNDQADSTESPKN